MIADKQKHFETIWVTHGIWFFPKVLTWVSCCLPQYGCVWNLLLLRTALTPLFMDIAYAAKIDDDLIQVESSYLNKFIAPSTSFEPTYRFY